MLIDLRLLAMSCIEVAASRFYSGHTIDKPVRRFARNL